MKLINGIINVYKEQGFTSHDVVAKLRGILKMKKIGHTGTLDPDAEGVLPVCLGKATKLCDLLTDKDKTYETVLLLGQTTDTQDTSGTVLSQQEAVFTDEEIKEVVSSFIGDILQVPPMYSALKVNGKKLYELAREGIEVERKARPITIFDIQILDIKSITVMEEATGESLAQMQVRMNVHCSKGTYIRTLCHDIGEKLGCGGCMKELKRTRVANFLIEDSLKLAELEQLKREDKIETVVVAVDEMFPKAPKVTVAKEYSKFIYNGNTFTKRHLKDRIENDGLSEVRVYDEEGTFVGLYEFDQEKKCFKVVKMFL